MCNLGKYFGTDGVRGEANTVLTPEVAFKLGRVSGHVFAREGSKPKVLIGRDPRISGEMFEGALIAGLLSTGAEVMRLGVISTPGVAYLTKVTNAELGIMISASHNSFEDNGIKLFGPSGFKLTDDEENDIEKLMDEEDTIPRPVGENVGTVINYFEGSQKYLSYLKETVDNDFDDLDIGLDCAHGATSSLAPHLFADLEAEIFTIGNNPNGININDQVGSTHPQALQELVKEKELDVGFAFDGDGDRLIAVDENGDVLDGDQIMYICAKYLNDQSKLSKSTVVGTVMSNLGFHKALEAVDINVIKANVGDRYVMEALRNGDYNFGGEQSGHVIFMDHSTGGDGMLTAIQLANIMKETNLTLSQLAAEMTVFPQILKNIQVVNKEAALVNPDILSEVERVEKELGDSGRVLLRPSGTESLIRIMVEAETKQICEKYIDQLTDVVNRTVQ